MTEYDGDMEVLGFDFVGNLLAFLWQRLSRDQCVEVAEQQYLECLKIQVKSSICCLRRCPRIPRIFFQMFPVHASRMVVAAM